MLNRKATNKAGTLLVALFLSTGWMASAQGQDPEAVSKNMTDRMKTELSLSEEQYQKVAPANLEFFKGVKEVRQSEAARAEKMAKMRELKRKREAAFKAVLNEEQMMQFKAQQQEHRKTLRDKRADLTE
jgi:hypothetical protein